MVHYPIKMSAVTGKNAIANVLGNFAGPLVGLVMTPFYLRIIGLEGLGLIGLMAIVTTTLQVFVSGASKSYQRDVSLVHSSAPENLTGLTRGALMAFASLGLFLALLVWVGGHSQLESLVAKTNFAPEILARTLGFIAVLLALGIFNGALNATLLALRDQVWPTVFGVATMVTTAAVNWMVLSRIPRVDLFYLVHFGGALGLCVCLCLRARMILARRSEGVKSLSIREAWRDRLAQSGRLSLVLIIHEGLGTLITQIDRMLVTSRLPLLALGTYNLGANPARMTSIFTNAINWVSFPEFCRLTRDERGRRVTGEYLGRVTFLMVLLFGAGMIVLVPAAGALLDLWLGHANVPSGAASCLVLLAAGNFLLAIAGPAYNLTVAFGRVSYGITKNVIALVVLPPLGYVLIERWGLAGAAMVPVCYACLCIGVCATVAYSRHAELGAASRWLIASGTCLVVAGIVAWALESLPVRGVNLIVLASGSALAFVAMFLLGCFGRNPRKWFLVLELAEQSEHGENAEAFAGSAR